MITFQTQNVDMPRLDFAKIEIWLGKVADSYGKTIGKLNYIFCNDDEILKVNRCFLNHDYFTDIITFDYTHKNKVGGDLFISLDTVASNALELGVNYNRELLRVIVHGLLHLCGIDDKGPGQREEMERNEDKSLELFNEI